MTMQARALIVCVLGLASALALAQVVSPHPHWEFTATAPAGHTIRLTLALKQRNMDRVRAIAEDVNDPKSPNYGSFLTLPEVADLIGQSPSTLSQLTTYLTESGATHIEAHNTRDFLTVDMPSHLVSKVFGAPVHYFTHKGSGRVVVRAHPAEVTIPEALAEHVELVTGLYDFFDYPKERKQLRKQLNAASASTCGSSAPDFEGRILGGEGDIGVQVYIYCANGQPTMNAAAPCADYPPALAGITMNVTAVGGHPTQTVYAPLSDIDCEMHGANVLCTMPTQFVSNYARLFISAQFSYSNGQVSEVGTYPTLFATSEYTTPQSIFDMYGIPQGTRATNPKNSQSVTAFEEQFIDVDGDLQSFFANMGMPFQRPTVVGLNNQSNPGGESTLDIQYVMGVGAGVPTYFWSVTGPGPAIPPGQGAYILEWAVAVLDADVQPLVTSISYGDTEDGYYNKFNGSFVYITRMENELAIMASLGMTVIAGAGDAGASNVGEAGNDISPTDPACTPFRPFYPSNSPWVLSVSSTFRSPNALPVCYNQLDKMQPLVCSEIGEIPVGVSQGLFWTTGGGFSNMSSNPTPSWQADFVQTYLTTMAAQNKLPPSSVFNQKGRGYPDMATIGHNELCILGGQLRPVDGTSASGPVLAGLISLINEERLNNGKKPVGHINPALYLAKQTVPGTFRDVVVGTNKDGDIQAKCSAYPTTCEYGFYAAPGWDPSSGLGTPNFPVLLEFMMDIAV